MRIEIYPETKEDADMMGTPWPEGNVKLYGCKAVVATRGKKPRTETHMFGVGCSILFTAEGSELANRDVRPDVICTTIRKLEHKLQHMEMLQELKKEAEEHPIVTAEPMPTNGPQLGIRR